MSSSRNGADSEEPNENTHAPGLPFPEVPYPWLVWFAPLGADLLRDVRTCSRAKEDPNGVEADPAFYVGASAGVLEQIEAAARELSAPGGPETRLAFTEDRNRLTGTSAVIVRRVLAGGRFSRPLAELVTSSGLLDDAALDSEQYLGWVASSGRLEIVIHAEGKKPRAPRISFAVVRLRDEPRSFGYLARLLLTDFEICQWVDPELELGATSVT
jgi:hypothetical protein